MNERSLERQKEETFGEKKETNRQTLDKIYLPCGN